jgi:hypothetical protein
MSTGNGVNALYSLFDYMWGLTTDSSVVQRDTDSTPMVTIVLANDGLAVKLPKSSVMIRACGDQICRISAKRAIPDPSLVTMQSCLKRESASVSFHWQVISWLGIVGLRSVD